jgi:hypothetical protein
MNIVIIFSLTFFFIFCFYDRQNINKFAATVVQINIYLKSKENSKKICEHKDQKKNNKKNNKDDKDNKKQKIKKFESIDIHNSSKIRDKILNNKFIDKNKKRLKTSTGNKKLLFPPKKNIIFNNKKYDKSLFSKKKNDNNNSTRKNLLNNDKQNEIKINNQKANVNIINIENINIGKTKGKNKDYIKFSSRLQSFKTNQGTKEKDVAINNLDNNKNNKKYNYLFNKSFNITSKDVSAFNDAELNNLIYKEAIIFDKRTYIQYYWSLLKKKQLILFTFYPANDYNLVTAKICLFFLSFSLYFTINAFFFNDETMHKIYMNNGAFDIIIQIPQIIYSSLISSITNMILKQLSLSEKTILELKEKKDSRIMIESLKNSKMFEN